MSAREELQDPGNMRTRLVEEVSEQMDAIEAECGGDFEIGRTITIVEVIRPGETTQRPTVEVRVRSAQLTWVTLGLLEWAKRIVTAKSEIPGGETR